MACRDYLGKMVDRLNGSCLVSSPLLAEAIAVKKAILLAHSRGWRRIVVETDAKDIMLQLRDPNGCKSWECEAVIQDILLAGSFFDFVQFNHVLRSANRRVNWVASQSRKFGCWLGWVSCPPFPSTVVFFGSRF